MKSQILLVLFSSVSSVNSFSLNFGSRQAKGARFAHTGSPDDDPRSIIEAVTRRNAISTSLGLASFATFFSPSEAAGAADGQPRSPRPTFYEIKMVNPPQMQPFSSRGERRVVGELTKLPAVVIGGHDTASDSELEAKLLRQLSEGAGSRGIVVASSAAVQEEGTQAALDAYVSRANADEAAAEETLRAGSVWVAGGSCDSLLPVLRVARQLGGVRVVAVGVADATVAQVRAKGLEAAAGLVKDRSAFVEAVKAPGFKRYSDMVIGGLFDAQSKGAGSDKEQSLANFFASQIVVDEAIAQRSLDAAKSSQGALLVVLTGAERVRFGYGVQARLARLATATSDDVDIRSLLLNPSAEESLSMTSQLRLVLGYGDELEYSKPLANYLLFSSSPPPKILSRMLNPM
eukprot:CAMPEP_0172636806 /NCGR_PEP_ID=MMETSP1068-20121228/205729_1 /TAXON_ID=35684 /ORGANISM="Pseudopedinella elastica, Strain CCMP716" /LENGTH=402 /DNA_ID=CAMNT_0013449317 /DNA_START=69 /DNA_END=1277 /DNA_ORIENTATION=-